MTHGDSMMELMENTSKTKEELSENTDNNNNNNNSSSDQDDKKVIGVNFNCALTKVDDVTHHFEVDFDLLMHYKIPEELIDVNAKDCFSAVGESDEIREKILIPETYIWNVDSESDNGVNIYVNIKRGIALYQKNYIAVWRQGLDLRRFPFDRHLLHMPVSFQNCLIKPWDVDLSDCPDVPFTFQASFQCYTSLGNWKLYDAVQRFEPARKDLTLILLRVERLATYYIYNVAMFTFFISLSTASVTALPPESFTDRQSIALTLMLTAVAFKYIVAQQLPPVSYMTLMDKYILASFMVIVIVMAENLLLVLLGPSQSQDLTEEQQILIDRIFIGTLFGAWIVSHLVCIFLKKSYFLLEWDEVENIRSQVIQRRQAIKSPWKRVQGNKNEMEGIIQ